MLKKRICFVTGAGASIDYGYPTTPTLTREIINLDAMSLFPGNSKDPAAELNRAQLREFQDQLRRSRSRSVDKFVQLQPQHDSIARLAVAYLILTKESDQAHTPQAAHPDESKPNPDWITELVNIMVSNVASEDDFFAQTISFVTFNYDRSIEQCLTNAAAGFFGIPLDIAWNKVKTNFPIHHVYGVAGEYAPAIIDNRHLRPRGSGVTPRQITFGRIADGARLEQPDVVASLASIGAGSLKFIHRADQIATDTGVSPKSGGEQKPIAQNPIAEIFRSTESLCFLGFGFDRDNISHLNLDCLPLGARIYGTCYRISDRDKRTALETIYNRRYVNLRRDYNEEKSTPRLTGVTCADLVTECKGIA